MVHSGYIPLSISPLTRHPGNGQSWATHGKQHAPNHQCQINSQLPNLKMGQIQKPFAMLIAPPLIPGIPLVQGNRVWGFEFGCCDLFVIWSL
jgi:hypothetical protein